MTYPTRHLAASCLLLIFASMGFAQSGCNDAGTITLSGFSGQSSDTLLPQIFLCAGDTLFVQHNGDADLSGDPNPATAPGIGYAIYDCLPSISGPDLASIVADPCLNTTSPILVGGFPINQTQGIWIIGDNPNGNAFLPNNGYFQDGFNGGGPLELWFAPITVDNFAAFSLENDGMGGPDGPCVDVSVNQAISVVFLNEIQVGPLNTNPAFSDCTGSFSITGGLPEWDPTTNYDISVFQSTNPNITGTVIDTPAHGGLATFSVPVPGQYTITVSDGKSCSTSFSANMSTCESVDFVLPFETALTGDNVCLPVTVENFTNIQSVQFTISWDPTVLQYTGVGAFNPALPGLAQGSFNANAAQGFLTLSWNDMSFMGLDLADGQVMFEICFDVIGQIGSYSPVVFTDTPTDIEITNGNSLELGFNGQNGQVNVTNMPLFTVIQTDSTDCANTADGAFNIQVFGGMQGYQLSWNSVPPAGMNSGPVTIPNEGGIFSLGNLAAGSYQISVTDQSMPANTQVDTFEILAPPALTVNINPTLVQCFGDSTGTLFAEVNLGGTPVPDQSIYDFNWNTSAQNTDQLTGLPAGFYSLTVTAPDGCNTVSSVTTSQPTALTLNSTVTNVTCPGADDGSIMVTAAGGTSTSGNYTFDWSTGTSVNTTNFTLTDLAPGPYCLTVTDDNGCQTEACFDLIVEKTLVINSVAQDISCNNACDGSIDVTGATNGSAPSLPYTFNWAGPIGLPPVNTNTTSELNSLCPGTYFLTMTDSDPAGCEILDTFIIQQPAMLNMTVINTSPAGCSGGADGSATVGVTGGTWPYTFLWPDGQTDSVVTGLTPGQYTVQVTDANSCTATIDLTIGSTAGPNLAPIVNDTILCANGTNGSLEVNATPNGSPIVAYDWSSGSNSFAAGNLSPGTYTVTVTAADGCISVDSGTVVSPPPLVALDTITRIPTCPGDNDGFIQVPADGGTGPYNYTWEFQGIVINAPPDTIGGLFPGSYSLSITDANNCPPLVLDDILLAEPPAIELTGASLDSASCFSGTCDGGATITAGLTDNSGGLFNFNWASGQVTGGATSSSATALCAGFETITITDSRGCQIVDSILIPSPPEILANTQVSPVNCFGESSGSATLNPTGGTQPFDFLWLASGQTTPSISNQPAGTYNVVITDGNGCTLSQQIDIPQPDLLELDINTLLTEDISCNDEADGVIGVQVNDQDNINPLGPDPFTWSTNAPAGADSLATGLGPGSYSVTVTDSKGCRDSVSYTLTEPSAVVGSLLTPEDPPCFGDPTLLMVDTAFGGSGNSPQDYTFMVDQNGLFVPITQPVAVFAGDHYVQIFDGNGCFVEATVTVNQPAPVTVEFNPDMLVVELGDTTRRMNPVINVGSIPPIDTFIWSPAQGLSDPTAPRPYILPFNDVTYTLTVVNINGCSASAMVSVEVDNPLNVFIPNAFSPNDDGANDEFRIYSCLGVRRIRTARLFDRWGNFITEALDLPPDCNGYPLWDGRLRGKLMDPGIYVYLVEVEFEDGRVLIYRGDVTLMR